MRGRYLTYLDFVILLLESWGWGLMFKHLIWDFDGTLFDTYPGISKTFIKVINEQYGKHYSYEKVLNWCKKSLDTCGGNLANDLDINKDELMIKFSREYRDLGAPIEEPPFYGAREICEKIIRNNGMNLLVTHRSYVTLKRLLIKYKMYKYFRELITGDDNYPRKPDPSSFIYLITKFNLRKDQVLAIGDRDLDIQAAKNAGIRSCYFSPEGKTYLDTDLHIKNLSDLENIL